MSHPKGEREVQNHCDYPIATERNLELETSCNVTTTTRAKAYF